MWVKVSQCYQKKLNYTEQKLQQFCIIFSHLQLVLCDAFVWTIWQRVYVNNNRNLINKLFEIKYRQYIKLKLISVLFLFFLNIIR